MSVFVASLNSGSNGNCYYVGTAEEAVLIDAGISCREVERRMKRLGLDMLKVKAIFLSHEHTDHTKGISGILKKYRFPVYANHKTLLNSGLTIDENRCVSFIGQDEVRIGAISVTPFPKLHDACDPCSFIVNCKKITIGVFTDIGSACANVISRFSQCHAAFLETNYDEAMLEQGSYPYYLKRRITGGKGHLSNSQALELFVKHKPAYMSHLFLSHLSKNNNCPTLVEGLFRKHAGAVQVVIASRYVETPLYYIRNRLALRRKLQSSTYDIHQLAFTF